MRGEWWYIISATHSRKEKRKSDECNIIETDNFRSIHYCSSHYDWSTFVVKFNAGYIGICHCKTRNNLVIIWDKWNRSRYYTRKFLAISWRLMVNNKFTDYWSKLKMNLYWHNHFSIICSAKCFSVMCLCYFRSTSKEKYQVF